MASNTRACRICFDTKSENRVTFDSAESDWTHLFEFCVGVVVVPGSNAPRVLCKTCADKLREFAEFKNKCLKSDTFWKEVTTTITVGKKSPAPIKTEPEDETCEDVCDYDEARIRSEQALLYASHENKDEIVIGPTEIRHPPPGVNYPHWEVARRALAKKGFDSEAELQRLYGSRLELRDAADELLCARCGQWSLTAVEQHQHQRAAHSTEHPRNCLQLEACTSYVGNDFQAQLTAFTDQRENTSQPATLIHKLLICDLFQNHNGSKPACVKGGKSFTREVHNGPKAFLCNTCGKGFTQQSQLSQHLRIHNGLKPYACAICDKRFTQQSNLSQHLRIHNGLKRYACAMCDKRFTQQSHLSQHLRIHNGLKPYACVTCDKRFTQQSTLSKHLSIHNGLKPFVCDECGKSFACKSNLPRHMLIHNRC